MPSCCAQASAEQFRDALVEPSSTGRPWYLPAALTFSISLGLALAALLEFLECDRGIISNSIELVVPSIGPVNISPFVSCIP
jgi:hypothetical protein